MNAGSSSPTIPAHGRHMVKAIFPGICSLPSFVAPFFEVLAYHRYAIYTERTSMLVWKLAPAMNCLLCIHFSFALITIRLMPNLLDYYIRTCWQCVWWPQPYLHSSTRACGGNSSSSHYLIFSSIHCSSSPQKVWSWITPNEVHIFPSLHKKKKEKEIIISFHIPTLY